MIPLPQSPWTLAIAELLGLRLAARGSGAQPADLLANLLPKRESPPEGWLEHFLASTPVPGVISEPGTGGSSMTFPLSAAPPIPSGIPPHPPQGKGPTDQHFGTLWEHTLKCMALAAQSEGGIPGCEPSHKQAVLGSGSESCLPAAVLRAWRIGLSFRRRIPAVSAIERNDGWLLHAEPRRRRGR